VYKLGLGQSPFPVPPSVVAALREHAHRKEYLAVRGLAPLREQIAAFYRKRTGGGYGGDDVLVGPGSKELMFLAQLVFYGDILLPSPSWVSYSPQARIIGRQVSWIATRREDGWKLLPDDLDAVCRRDPGRPRLLVLNYPSNPTGNTYTAGELAGLGEVARRHGVIVLSDEIYGELHHEGAHASIASAYPEGTIIASGLSKWCGAGGWRLGAFVFPRELSWLADGMAVVASETYTSTSAPIQWAAITAFACGPEIEAYLVRERAILRALGEWCHRRLVSAGLDCTAPRGGFYLFPGFAAVAPTLRARGIDGGEALCEQLLRQAGVALLPGSDFGRPDGDLTARLAYVDFDGEAALAACEPDVALDEAWLRRATPRVLQAIDSIVEFVT
jgi:aspartate aminotransferase